MPLLWSQLNELLINFPDQQRLDGVHGGGIQTSPSARRQRRGQVLVAYHGATAGEHDPPVRRHGAHALSGRG